MELNHRCLDVSQESCRWTTGLFSFVQWTHRELHSDFRRAEPTSSCWTMSPFDQSSGGWNRTNVLLVQSQASLPTATAPE